MACFLPVRPFAFLGPSGLPSLAASIVPLTKRKRLSSLALRRHLKRLAPTLATTNFCVMSTMIQLPSYLA